MQPLGPNSEAGLHTDGNRMIEFPEFLAMQSRLMDINPEEIRRAFKVFDRTGKGYIGPAELKYALAGLGESYVLS